MEQIVEYQQWGWNLATSSAGAIFLLTLLQYRGLWYQRKEVEKNPQAEGLSVMWLGFSAAMFGALVIYGATIKSVAVLFNGCLVLVGHLRLLYRLKHGRGFRAIEWLLFATLSLALLAMLWLPYKEAFFLAFNIGGVGAISLQPLKIISAGTSKGVDPRMLVIACVNTTFWTMYAFAIGDWILEIMSPTSLVLYLVSLYCWWRYPPPITTPDTT